MTYSLSQLIAPQFNTHVSRALREVLRTIRNTAPEKEWFFPFELADFGAQFKILNSTPSFEWLLHWGCINRTFQLHLLEINFDPKVKVYFEIKSELQIESIFLHSPKFSTINIKSNVPVEIWNNSPNSQTANQRSKIFFSGSIINIRNNRLYKNIRRFQPHIYLNIQHSTCLVHINGSYNQVRVTGNKIELNLFAKISDLYIFGIKDSTVRAAARNHHFDHNYKIERVTITRYTILSVQWEFDHVPILRIGKKSVIGTFITSPLDALITESEISYFQVITKSPRNKSHLKFGHVDRVNWHTHKTQIGCLFIDSDAMIEGYNCEIGHIGVREKGELTQLILDQSKLKTLQFVESDLTNCSLLSFHSSTINRIQGFGEVEKFLPNPSNIRSAHLSQWHESVLFLEIFFKEHQLSDLPLQLRAFNQHIKMRSSSGILKFVLFFYWITCGYGRSLLFPVALYISVFIFFAILHLFVELFPLRTLDASEHLKAMSAIDWEKRYHRPLARGVFPFIQLSKQTGFFHEFLSSLHAALSGVFLFLFGFVVRNRTRLFA